MHISGVGEASDIVDPHDLASRPRPPRQDARLPRDFGASWVVCHPVTQSLHQVGLRHMT